VNISSPLPTSTTVQVGAVDTTISTGTSLFAILGDMQGDADTQIDIDTFTSILQKNVLQMNTIDTAPIRNVLVSALEESESTSRTLLASLTREQNENMNTVQTTVDTYIADSERIDREMIANIGLSNYK
jgi:fibronectin type 3 domain-containing protein